MKQILIILLGLLFIMPISADDPKKLNLSYNGGGGKNLHRSMHPFVLVLNNGDVMVLWEEGPSERNSDIVYRILDHETGEWYPNLYTSPAMAAQHLNSCTFPMAVEASDGSVHVSYQDGNAQKNRDTFYVNYKNGIWSDRERVRRTVQNSCWPRIAIDKATDEVYVTWSHQHLLGKTTPESDIVFCKRDMVTGSWSTTVNLSKSQKTITMHQATTFTNGRLYNITQDGHEGSWHILASSSSGIANASSVDTPIHLAGGGGGYWPEIASDDIGNVYGIFSTRQHDIQYVYKPKGGNWTLPRIVHSGGRKDFFGLNVAQNGVAYAIHQVGYDSGFLPVFVRFTHGNVSKRIVMDTNAKYPKRFHIDIDDEGAVYGVWSDFPGGDSPHTDSYASDVWFRKISQIGGPKVKITTDTLTAITNDTINFTGNVTSAPSAITTHSWYINKNKLESTTASMSKTFTTPGIYTIHYYVADAENLLGHASYNLEVLDVPYKPENTSFSFEVIKAYIYRAYINKIHWDDDSRNEEKFTDLDHFNVYRRLVGASEWGTAIATVNYTSTGAEFIDKSMVFTSQSDAQKYEYAITTVAIIGGQDKESKLTTITFGSTPTRFADKSSKSVILEK